MLYWESRFFYQTNKKNEENDKLFLELIKNLVELTRVLSRGILSNQEKCYFSIF